MTRKSLKNLILCSLIGYWAVLGFKTAVAMDIGGYGETPDLEIGSGSGSDDTELNVSDYAETTNAVINSGGTAHYYNESKGTGTTINGGDVTLHDLAEFNNTYSNGNLLAQDSSKLYTTQVVGGSVTAEDNATVSGMTIDGTDAIVTIQGSSTASDITLRNGTLKITSDKQVNNVEIEGGNTELNGAYGSEFTISGGSLGLYNSSTIEKTNIEGGTVEINEGSISAEATVDGGTLDVLDGSAYGTTIKSGTMNASDSAEVTDTIVEGGTLNVTENAIVSKTTVNGGEVIVSGSSGNTGYVSETTVNSGGNALFTGDTLGYNTTIDGGTVTAKGNALLTIQPDGQNIIKNGGQLNLQDNASADNFTLEKGSVTVSDNAVLSQSNVTGEVSITMAGQTADPNTPGGFINNITVENGGNLWLHDKKGTVGGIVDDVTVKKGGMLTSNKFDSDDDSYSNFTANSLIIEQGGKFNLSTNDEIGQLITYSSLGANKTGIIHEGVADNFYVGSGSTFTVKENNSGTNIVVEGGNLNVDVDGFLQNSTISGGIANIYGYAQYTTFNGTSVLYARSGSTIENASFLDSANVNIEDYTSLKGALNIGSRVTGLDASQLFTQGTELTNLTLSSGLNPIFSSGIINQDTNTSHDLTLFGNALGKNYNPDVIRGWKNLFLQNANLTAGNNIILEGGNLNINSSSSLFVKGNIRVQGGLINNGTIDLVKSDSTVGNTLTIDGDYVGGTNSRMELNVDIESAEADKIIITGNASGSTEVYLTSANDGAPLRDDILFAQAGSASGESVFNIHRVAGSYYEWDTVFKNNQWYASVKNAIKDDKFILVPEAVAYYGLIDNTFMQTSSLGESLRNNIAISEYQKVPCKNAKRGENAICRSNRPAFSGWLAPATTSISVETPYVYDAEITGFDGGLDLLSNGYTKLGLLASYRQGKYNYEENGEKYEIIGTAETTINSYLAGAYLRHDSQNWSTILAGYAGIIDTDISTDDDVNTSTSGTTYGATLDVSYIYKNINGLRIEPGVRISYTAVDMDPVEDNAGKTQEFDNASRTEVEAGIKFAKRWEFPDSRAEIFVRPSIVHIMDDASEFTIDNENSLAQADDRTVAKVSAGISFDMTSKLSASLAGSYSVGDDYTNSSGNVSVMYKF